MGERNGFTLIELVVVILIVVVLLAILMPPLGKVKPIAQRVVCGTNLKGLGTAQGVYANDYDGAYPQLPGKGAWSKRLGFDYYHAKADFSEGGAEEYNSRTITSSWYLLVREADMWQKSFVCPSSSQVPFEGENPENVDIVELWDFGADPYKHVSYSMHNPYGKYPAHDELSGAFAVAADMSPWFKNGDIVGAGEDGSTPQLLSDDWSMNAQVEKSQTQVANSLHHVRQGHKYGEGQNVLFGDGHNSYEKRSDVGVRHDGIYTYQSGGDIRIGTNPTARDEGNDAMSRKDSFLGI